MRSEKEPVAEPDLELVHGGGPAEGAGAADASLGDLAVAVDMATFDVADAEVEHLHGGGRTGSARMS